MPSEKLIATWKEAFARKFRFEVEENEFLTQIEFDLKKESIYGRIRLEQSKLIQNN